MQLHWQDRADHSRTEFVAQTEFTDPAAFKAWLREVTTRRGGEMPEGWCPMVCTEDSDHFMLTARS